MNALALMQAVEAPVVEDPMVGCDVEALAERAAEELGYGGLRNYVRSKSAKSVLGRAFVAADVGVIPTAKVEEYKQFMLDKQERLREAAGGRDTARVAVERTGFMSRLIGGAEPDPRPEPMETEEVPVDREWRTYSISAQRAQVPTEGLRLALAVKAHLPEDATIGVEAFQSRREWVADDPFLYAEYNDARYYFYVWDDPEFDDFDDVVPRESTILPVFV